MRRQRRGIRDERPSSWRHATARSAVRAGLRKTPTRTSAAASSPGTSSRARSTSVDVSGLTVVSVSLPRRPPGCARRPSKMSIALFVDEAATAEQARRVGQALSAASWAARWASSPRCTTRRPAPSSAPTIAFVARRRHHARRRVADARRRPTMRHTLVDRAARSRSSTSTLASLARHAGRGLQVRLPDPLEPVSSSVGTSRSRAQRDARTLRLRAR